MNVRRKKNLGIPASKSGGYVPKFRSNPPTVPCVIQCTRCSGPAHFEEPFNFITGDISKPPRNAIKFGDVLVIEKYPQVFPWASPDKHLRISGWAFRRSIKDIWGVFTCPSCTHRAKHLLKWPQDAYYTTSVRGETLWAGTREEIDALRDYIIHGRKVQEKARGHFWFLRHVPKHFIQIKHRDEALKKLDRLLEGK